MFTFKSRLDHGQFQAGHSKSWYSSNDELTMSEETSLFPSLISSFSPLPFSLAVCTGRNGEESVARGVITNFALLQPLRRTFPPMILKTKCQVRSYRACHSSADRAEMDGLQIKDRVQASLIQSSHNKNDKHTMSARILLGNKKSLCACASLRRSSKRQGLQSSHILFPVFRPVLRTLSILLCFFPLVGLPLLV